MFNKWYKSKSKKKKKLLTKITEMRENSRENTIVAAKDRYDKNSLLDVLSWYGTTWPR